MKTRILNLKGIIILNLLFVGSIFLMAHNPEQSRSIEKGQILQEYQLFASQAMCMLVVNPVDKKQLNLEKKVSKKEQRKALKKYLRSMKKDLKKNNKGGDRNHLKVQKKTDAVAIIMLILFGILIAGLIFLSSVFSEGLI